ncbi:MAG: N-acetyltransferase, partial [Gammaproteobacteria bacterium]|nr:N-acetyltransferase [Gammaproteobacteria bacterium]
MNQRQPVSFHDRMTGLDAASWNALAGDYPFLRHEFLAALETTGCVSPAVGWIPHHLRIGPPTQPLALAPLYEKTHSWGEFVFDFAWARAWESRGLDYYPKLLLAIPFTPATGPRVLCAAGEDGGERARRA